MTVMEYKRLARSQGWTRPMVDCLTSNPVQYEVYDNVEWQTKRARGRTLEEACRRAGILPATPERDTSDA